MLPQVIIGWGGRGDLPSVNPSELAIILSGLANVHAPSSGGTLELMNERLGNLGIPSGGVRLFINHPNKNPRQPLYNDDRVRGKNGRPFVLDIFLRLAKQTLIGSELAILTPNVSEQEHQELDEDVERGSSHLKEVLDAYEELDEEYKKLVQENKTFKRVNEKQQNQITDLQSNMSQLEDKIDNWKDKYEHLESEMENEINRLKGQASESKEKIKNLKKEKQQYVELAEDYENYEQLKENGDF